MGGRYSGQESCLCPVAANTRKAHGTGLSFWMERVLEECDHLSAGLAADPVHDLRVALRRCRSLADGIMTVDPDPAWKQMRKAGKRLFNGLGELRDTQVLEEWVQRLGSRDDPVTVALLQFLTVREAQLKGEASAAVQAFDRKQWARWSKQLPHRAARLKPGSTVFKHLALERWTEACDLHRAVLRSRSPSSWHRLRIGLKRFRYLVENFLPEQHLAWKADLKELQDRLGEIHDLDVLWNTALRVHVFPDAEARAPWHAKINAERDHRVAAYRQRMLGKTSLWQVWRAGLPRGEEVEAAGLNRLKLWASFRDPDFRHANHVTRLALQLYDGLADSGKAPSAPRDRAILRIAALLQDVGRMKKQNGHHRASYRLIRDMTPPLGWSPGELQMAAVAARYHRGALPRLRQRALRNLSPVERQQAKLMAAILRLANALDAQHDGRIRRVQVHQQNGILLIGAIGYSSHSSIAESIAGARHLLEIMCRCPVVVRPWRRSKSSPHHAK